MMTMNQIGDIPYRGYDKFGLGFQIVSEKNGDVPAQPGSYSWGGAYATSYWVDPKEKIITILYRQMWGTHGGEIDNKFRVLVYQALN